MFKLFSSLIILVLLFTGCNNFTVNTVLKFPGYPKYLGEHIDQVEYWETKHLEHKLISQTDSLKRFEIIKSFTTIDIYSENDTVTKVTIIGTATNPMYFKQLVLNTLNLMENLGFTKPFYEETFPGGIAGLFKTKENPSCLCIFVLINKKNIGVILLTFITETSSEEYKPAKNLYMTLEK